jgi:hypothetical protein
MIKLIDLLRESQGVLGNYTPKSFKPDTNSLNKEEHTVLMNDLQGKGMDFMKYISFVHSMIGDNPIYKVIFSKLFRANKDKIDFSLDQNDLLKDWNKEIPDSVKLQKFKTFYEKHKNNFPDWADNNKKLYQDAIQAILPSLNEAELSNHYSDRKTEREEILDIIIPAKAYEGYNLDDVKDKLIPLLKSKLLSQLEVLENKNIDASKTFNIGYQVFFPRIENQGNFYPIQMTTKATVGGSSVEKENKGIIYGAIIKDNTLITLIILNDASGPFFKEKIIEHDKRIGKVNNKETKIFKDPNCDFIINIDELFGKKVEKPREEKTEEDSLPYKVKTDYRLKSKFTHKKYGTGTVIKTSEGGGKPNSIGKVDWIDVRFDNPSGGRPAFTERFNRLITNVYYDKQLKND